MCWERRARSFDRTNLDKSGDHIITTLKSCNWKVYGPGGAAELLDMNVSTLNSRMKKLGINKVKLDQR